MSNRYQHKYEETEFIRGLNYTTPDHRRELIALLGAIQFLYGGRGAYGGFRIAPQIVDYCSLVLAPHVAAFRRSRRTWEGLRAFEEEEGRWRKPYVPGLGPLELKKRLSRGQRAWMAA